MDKNMILEGRKIDINDYICKLCSLGEIGTLKQYLSQRNIDIRDIKNNYNNTPLTFAAASDKLHIVKYLIQKGVNINFVNNAGNSALIVASTKDVYKYLILSGADITIENIQQHSCLDFHKDVYNGDYDFWDSAYEIQKLIIEKNPKWIHELMKHKIPLHKWIQEEYPEDSISDELGFFESVIDPAKHLLIACETGDLNIVKKLVSQGAKINYNNKKIVTPLIASSMRGELEIVKYLVEQGANLEAKTYYGRTSAMYALMNSHLHTLKYLILKGANIITDKDYGNHTFLDYFSQNKQSYEMQKLIIEKNPKCIYELIKHKIPLHKWIKDEYPEAEISDELGFFEGKKEDDEEELVTSCQMGNLDRVKELVEKGVNIESRYINDWTPYINDWTPMTISANNGHLDIVKYLLQHGADIESKGNTDWTPLMCAINNVYIDVVKYLISKEIGRAHV